MKWLRRRRRRSRRVALNALLDAALNEGALVGDASRGPRIVVSGPCGVGKTTIGEALAIELDAAFLDADSLHPPANVSKMARGGALDDRDRAPWLSACAAALAAEAGGCVLACSALKRTYRAVFDASTVFVLLDVPMAVVLERVQKREGHFMPVSLVESQFDTLEAPGDDEGNVFVVDAARPVDDVVADILRVAAPGRGPPPPR
jgi:carbohydrate kinase (thermoresistant glucokinase family)